MGVSHVVVPGSGKGYGLVLGKGAGGEGLLYDLDLGTGVVRETDLGLTLGAGDRGLDVVVTGDGDFYSQQR